jgi:hypothetical protein
MGACGKNPQEALFLKNLNIYYYKCFLGDSWEYFSNNLRVMNLK